MVKKFQELVANIRDAVREKAQEIELFKTTGNGCIRILAFPLCKDADNWLGGMSDFDLDKPDVADYEYSFAITSRGSRVITGVWDGVKQDCDCYAFSALKIAHCARAVGKGAGMISGLDLGDPNLTTDNGYGPHRGAVCVKVRRCDYSANKQRTIIKKTSTDWCEFYVCVSGADSEDDLVCASVAIGVIEDFFETNQACGPFLAVYPDLNHE